MLLGRVGVALVAQHLQRVDDARSGIFRDDDVVDIAKLGCLIGIGEGRTVVVHELAASVGIVARGLELVAKDDVAFL